MNRGQLGGKKKIKCKIFVKSTEGLRGEERSKGGNRNGGGGVGIIERKIKKVWGGEGPKMLAA